MKLNTISIVIPVFRNQGSISLTHEKLKGLFSRLEIDQEYIFVNDGSDDNSLNELISLHESNNDVKVLSFSRNFGQVAAMIAGLREVTGDAVICMSADLQEPIELIENMVKQFQTGNEIVICHRVGREDSFIANVSSAIFYKFMRYINPKMPKGGFDFFLLGKNALDSINSLNERNRFIQGDILWLGYTTSFIPYERLKRTYGKSQWSLSKKLKYLIDGFINTSYIPIRLMSLIGLITSLSGFLYAALIIYNKIFGNTPFKGWAPIMVILLILGGFIMIMLGIIGEYLWRTYDETRKRALYIVEKKYDSKKQTL